MFITYSYLLPITLFAPPFSCLRTPFIPQFNYFLLINNASLYYVLHFLHLLILIPCLDYWVGSDQYSTKDTQFYPWQTDSESSKYICRAGIVGLHHSSVFNLLGTYTVIFVENAFVCTFSPAFVVCFLDYSYSHYGESTVFTTRLRKLNTVSCCQLFAFFLLRTVHFNPFPHLSFGLFEGGVLNFIYHYYLIIINNIINIIYCYLYWK